LSKAKPFKIPKRAVWEAYKRVKANRGAAGVDRQSLKAFGQDLENNLYKIWNRMCSGSYFPSSVLRVEIPNDGSKHLSNCRRVVSKSEERALPKDQ